MPAKSKAHYRGDYKRRARTLRAQAYANPATKCWRSGLTLAEGQVRWGDHIRWQAGHIIDGDPTSPLAAELSHPNQSAGATMGNLKRLGLLVTGSASRRW